MCDPVSLGLAGVSAAGSLIKTNEANENAQNIANARNAATTAELERQKKYGVAARGEFDKSLDLFGPGTQEASLAKAQSDIGSTLVHNTPDAARVGTITTANAPAAVGASEGKKLGDVFNYLGQSATNLGNLKGYDQNTFNTNLGLNQTGRNIDTIGDFAKVSSGVNKTEQQAAFTNAYKPPSGIGELLSFGGNLGANMAGRGNIKVPGFGGSMASPTFNPGTSAGAIY